METVPSEELYDGDVPSEELYDGDSARCSWFSQRFQLQKSAGH